jgi:hypothetical protein
MSSASLLTFLTAGDCPTANQILDLSYLQHPSTDGTEYTSPNSSIVASRSFHMDTPSQIVHWFMLENYSDH